ncbi:hypothetical protein BH11BAC3_BH11BAC3_28070 [soil metagenome]
MNANPGLNMMTNINRFNFTVLLICFCCFSSNAQTTGLPTEGPGFYFNNFQHYRGENVDSSMYFLRKLAENPSYAGTLQDLVHNSFSQVFLDMWDTLVKDSLQKIEMKKNAVAGRVILKSMLSDTNIILVNSAKPIEFWTKAQANKDDVQVLNKLTNDFIQTQLCEDIYENRVGRYALLIYKVIEPKKELSKLAAQLLETTFQKIKSNLVDEDDLSWEMREKKVWFKYMYAYANFLKANELVKLQQENAAGKWYKTAADNSPNLADNQFKHAYFYDMVFLLGEEKETFRDDYFNYLIKVSKDKNEALRTLMSMALINPVYKEKLKSFYDSTFTNQETFDAVWLKEVNKNAKPLLDFSLAKMDGTLFSTAGLNGKWALIDFWGTWCSPCRKEHPDLEKFYQSAMSTDSAHFIVLTIACKDNQDRVTDYMKQNNYSFPVAMADNEIENLYAINSYPSKLLITPQGNYLVVPFGINWVEFIKQYAGL